MDYDFLRAYNIPLRSRDSTKQYHSHRDEDYAAASGYSVMVSPPPPPPPAPSHASAASTLVLTGYEYEQHPYAYYDSSTYLNCATNETDSMQGAYYNENRSRYVAPGKQDTISDSYVTYHSKPYKRKYSGGTIERVTETSSDGTLVIFQGRHTSYPNELNQLIHPLSCEVCQVKMNSMLSAKDHYESKVHDRHLTMWLKKNYTDKGVEAPPVKRFLKQGSAGPEAYYCESCDLHLTSLSHATQHYSGRKHRSVISKMTKPSGLGHYDSHGKWIRMSSGKCAKDGRFGIGEKFKQFVSQTSIETSSTSIVRASTSSYNTTATSTTPSVIMKPAKADHLYCALCNVNVTSAIQMAMHLNGLKHKKKIQQKEGGEDGSTPSATTTTMTTTVNSISNSTASLNSAVVLSKMPTLSTVLQPDSTTPTISGAIDLNEMSMYRTPSGQYYCKVCNITMTNVVSLQQHLTGKRHVKSHMEKRAKAAISNYALNI